MGNWFFPSRGFGAIEGFSNPALEMFKGEPIRAMAREVCQNSLDAKLNNNQPLRVEFHRDFIPVKDFPGMDSIKEVLNKCQKFWSIRGDQKASTFFNDALKIANGDKMFVLRISDYNTTGLTGAFDDTEEVTPWSSLVKGSAISQKANDTAAGSFGIGKAAPFVVSKIQTVFYRTLDKDGVCATQGVTHLASFEDENTRVGEDKIRLSTGYYGETSQNKPYKNLEQLDNLNKRTESGTDLFIPAFNGAVAKATWADDIIIELLENFLYSIYSGNMEVVVDGKLINANNVDAYITRYMPKTKNALAFYNVIKPNEKVIEDTYPVGNLGEVYLRILYSAEGNKKVLVVRSSGMKISDIPSLPKGIPFSAFLEVRGEKLNSFFRQMENPQHNKWEPKRHPDSERAKQIKENVEEWVRSIIGDKIKEISGEEMDIDVSEFFFSSDRPDEQCDDKVENIIDAVKNLDFDKDDEKPKDQSFKVADIGGTMGKQSKRTRHGGTIDDVGAERGHRTPTGTRKKGEATGRMGVSEIEGNDTIYDRYHEVKVNARIIRKSDGINKMIFVAEENINKGELEIVTVGENGKPLKLKVKTAKGVNVFAEMFEGHIVVSNVQQKAKCIVEFEIHGEHNYAMGVRAYGN